MPCLAVSRRYEKAWRPCRGLRPVTLEGILAFGIATRMGPELVAVAGRVPTGTEDDHRQGEGVLRNELKALLQRASRFSKEWPWQVAGALAVVIVVRPLLAGFDVSIPNPFAEFWLGCRPRVHRVSPWLVAGGVPAGGPPQRVAVHRHYSQAACAKRDTRLHPRRLEELAGDPHEGPEQRRRRDGQGRRSGLDTALL